jgi:hypothetical protein
VRPLGECQHCVKWCVVAGRARVLAHSKAHTAQANRRMIACVRRAFHEITSCLTNGLRSWRWLLLEAPPVAGAAQLSSAIIRRAERT